MKNLYLLRHAKSSWDNPGLSDKDRPLNKRGLHDAPMMGERFRERGESLDLVFSSPARRAHTTAQLFCDACGYPADEIATEEGLYFLGRGAIENVIVNQSRSGRSDTDLLNSPPQYRRRSTHRRRAVSRGRQR